MTERKNVALIYGGRGFEHSVSVAGAKNLLPLIDCERYRVYPIYVSKEGRFFIRSPEDSESEGLVGAFPYNPLGKGGFVTEENKRIEIDCAFPLLHGDFGEDGTVQGLLTSAGISFVGCRTEASAICLDKAITKAAAEALGIPTVKWRLVTNEHEDLSDISFPAFVKPDCLGSSFGAGAAHGPAELSELLKKALRTGGGRVLIEDFKAPVRELECAFFEAQGERVLSPVGEILCPGFYSYEEKYSSNSRTKTTAKALLPRETEAKIREYSDALCSFIGVRHLARIDFFLADGELYFNEINTMPGMTATSLYLALLSKAGICPSEAVCRLISDAISEGNR